jgi:hypothetical protein
MLQPARAVLPFSFVALRFAAVILTESNIPRNFADKLSLDPIPDVLKKVHRVTATVFSFTRILRNSSWFTSVLHGRDAEDEGTTSSR